MDGGCNVFVLASIACCCLIRLCLAMSHLADDSCKDEVTYGFREKFTWNISTTTGFYVSTPFCLNEKGDLIERHCSDSTWIPEEVICHETLTNNRNQRRSVNNFSTQVETILTFDSKHQKVFLILYFANNVKKISCYAFVSKKIEVSHELLFDSKNTSWSGYSLNRYLVYELDIFEHPTEYWCEIFQKHNSTILVTQNVVGHQEGDRTYQEYAMKIGLDHGFSQKNFFNYCDRLDVKCRIMKYLNDSNQRAILTHVTLYFKNNRVINGYYKLQNYFKGLVNLKYIRSSDFCLPSKTFTNKELRWNLTTLGEKSKPSQLCLNDKGVLTTRKCVGDFLHGAYFEDFKKNCSDSVVGTNTAILYEILSKHNFTADIFKNFSSIIKEVPNVSINDVSLFSDGLFEASEMDYSEDIEEDYFDSVDVLNTLDPNVLITSQVSLNATDKILDSLEKFLVKKSEMGLNETNHTVLVQRKNLIIFATKPSFSNVSGIALYRIGSSSFMESTIKELSNVDVLQKIPRENLELALHVPSNLLDSNGNSSLIITVYYNDVLFNEENTTNVANSRVVAVTMPGMGRYLQTPIPLLLRPLENMDNKFIGCGFWQYGKASPSRQGQWSTKGGEDIDVDDMIYCAYSHLTHFGLLILSGRLSQDTENSAIAVDPLLSYDQGLSAITIIGCSLSLVGIAGIFITACVFRRFREKIGTKILMLLSLPISLEIILTQLAGLDDWHNNPTMCTVIGVLLHYVVLLKFSWMFVIALLQYFRFVKVLGPIPQKIFLKANLICWLVPTIPVALTASILPDSYTAGVQKFCYPKYMALYLGLFLPASIIVLFNILVFALIMISISNSKAIKYDKSGKMLRRQTYLAILLFFMLGIPWVFGILAEILQSGWIEVMFVYLFCLTATLQGFVLFAFYVVLDKDTRYLWVSYLKHRKT